MTPRLFPLLSSMNKNYRFPRTSCIIFYWYFSCFMNNRSYAYPLPVVLLFSSLPHVLNCMQEHLIPEGHQESISLLHVWDHFYIVRFHNGSLVHRLQENVNQVHKVYLILVLNDIAKVEKVCWGTAYTFMRSLRVQESLPCYNTTIFSLHRCISFTVQPLWMRSYLVC